MPLPPASARGMPGGMLVGADSLASTAMASAATSDRANAPMPSASASETPARVAPSATARYIAPVSR